MGWDIHRGLVMVNQSSQRLAHMVDGSATCFNWFCVGDAVDILNSISRLMIDIVSPEHLDLSNRLKSVLATYKDAEDLINLGAYVSGSNKNIDYAIKIKDKIDKYLRQDMNEKVDFRESIEGIKEIFNHQG